MFKIQIQGSSSAGNNYVLADGDSSLMIEAGMKVKDVLRKGADLSKVQGLLVTHEHGDHSKYAQDLLLSGQFDLWASSGTLEAINIHRRSHVLKAGVQQAIGDWIVLPFSTIHDHPTAPAKEPLGFLIQSPSKKKIVFMTDTNYGPSKFSGVTHWLVECNHDPSLVRKSTYPRTVQDRILLTHMSIDTCKLFFSKADMSATEEIYLIHLSDQNSDGERFKKEIEEITNKKVFIA